MFCLLANQLYIGSAGKKGFRVQSISKVWSLKSQGPNHLSKPETKSCLSWLRAASIKAQI